MSIDDDIRTRDLRIAALEQENALLKARLANLEARLNISSQNSSQPPSQDSLKARAERKKQQQAERAARKDKRKQGAQPGHKGHQRQLLPEAQVDHIVHHLPQPCCGHVHQVDDPHPSFQRHQVFELPQKLFSCTEHRLHTRRCPCCGKVAKAKLPQDLSLKGYGPNLVSVLAALNAVLRASRRGLDWFVGEFLGIPSSLGTINSALMEASAALEPAWHQARAEVERAQVVGLDETGWRLKQLPYWIWLMQCGGAAFYKIEDNRRKESATALIGGLQADVVVTDRYGAYHQLGATRNQACHAHLLRDIKRVSEREGPIGRAGARLLAWEKELLKLGSQHREGELARGEFVQSAAALRVQMQRECEQTKSRHGKSTPAVVKWLEGQEGERAWTFLEHEGVELTNNKSERELRRCVCHRKLAYGSQSEGGLRLMERLWTVSQSCQLQKRSAWKFISQALAAHRIGQQPPTLC